TLIPTSNNTTVRSLAIDEQGTIFVGAVGEFGYLAPDSIGKLSFHSLIEHIPDNERDFADVWTTLVKGDEVYFQTLHTLYRYKAARISSWPLTNSYHRSFVVHNQLYLRQHGKGLMMLQNDSLRLIPGGELFAEESVSAMVAYGEDILIGARERGLFRYNPTTGSLTPFYAAANAYLREGLLYHGIALADGNYAFATLKSGLLVMDPRGRILTTLTTSNGLQYDQALYLYSDASGAVWACLSNGISKAEIISPITTYNKIQGLEGGIVSVKRYKGTLYVSTYLGVYFLNDHNRFELVKGLQLQCWQLELFTPPGDESNHKLLVASAGGTYEVSREGAKLVFEGQSSALFSAVSDPYRVYIGLNGTFASIRYQNGKWVEEGMVQVLQEELRSIREDGAGNIWMGSIYRGLYRIKQTDWLSFVRTGDNSALEAAIKHYGLAEGLPSLNWNQLFWINNELTVTTQKGLYVYNSARNKFEKNIPIHHALQQEDRWFYHIQEDKAGNVWFDSDKGNGFLLKQGKGYKLSENLIKRVGISSENVVTGYGEANGVLWYGTPDGLFRFDTKFKGDFQKPNAALIRKVVLSDDSVIFHGTYYDAHSGNLSPLVPASLNASLVQPKALKQEFNYAYNSISFHFSSPGCEDETACQYSYFLEGYDNNWSTWTRENKKEYTNLPEGQYTFRVRAFNYYENPSQEASYKFGIAPPWFRTPLAYGAYFLMLIGIVAFFSKANSSRLIKDNQRLESLVQSRTAEINEQKEKIEHQKNEVESSYKSLTTLSKIGQDITASLDLKSIIHTLYTSIDAMMDVSSFGVGVYNAQTQSIDFTYAMEEGRELPAFSHSLREKDRLAVWCFTHHQPIHINDLLQEYKTYIATLPPATGDKHAASIIYFPIKIKKKSIGVITVQSYQKNAYQGHHFDILQTLAAYTAIALDNSHAYLKLNESNSELSSTLNHLKQTQMQLVQSEKMASLGQLTAGVAHEINNPINFVSAGIDSLSVSWEELFRLLEQYNALAPEQCNAEQLQAIEKLKQELDIAYLLEEIPQLLTSVKAGAQRTTEIVKSLRNFTRLDEDNLKIADLHEGLESSLVILRNKIGDRIQVERAYAPDLAPLLCYPGPLNQVFMNILNNAIQAIEGNGTIKIETTQKDGFACICIQDSGKGMSSKVQERIFEPFFTTKEVGEGTGLGLSLSYSIIEKHKGKIKVESTPGKGTIFMIFLPLTPNNDGI
ncbi:MAG: GAF domain-containing protein, partial [Bacteroidetes bacterium]|nr:GAF domain-containing protein [Bacteroidota bacterium]